MLSGMCCPRSSSYASYASATAPVPRIFLFLLLFTDVLEGVWQTGIRAFSKVLGVGCGRSCIPTLGGHHAPTTLPVRPLRGRVGHPRTVALVGRKARPSAEVAAEARGKRGVLPPEERMLVADAAPRVSAVADGLLPLPQVEDRRPSQKSPRPAARGGARGRRTRTRSQRRGRRQPGREDHPGRRPAARLRRSETDGGEKAPPTRGHQRAGTGREGSQRRTARPRRRKAVVERWARAAKDGAALGRRRLHGRFPGVAEPPVGVAHGGAAPPREAAMALWARGEATWLPGFASPLGRGAYLRVAGSVATPE